MNIKRVKQKWNLAKTLCLTGTIFWLIETVYFIITEGWHLKAINDIVLYFWTASLILTGIVMIDIIEYLLSDKTNTMTKP